MAHGAAHDPAQHIAAALVRGQDAVGDQERRRAQVVGDHPVVDAAGTVGSAVGDVGRGLDQRPHQVGVEVVVLALQHRADALEPHAGVDRGAGQRVAGPVLVLLELHEDEVPDLDEPVAVLVGAARRATGDLRAVVVEDLRARAAGAGRAHHPEIVGGGDADDALVGEARDLPPELGRRVVVVEDGDEEPLLRQGEVAGQELPGVGDRQFLEVVAEREVAEHLEEGVMAGGVADVVEVVVLAPGAHAFLAGGGAHVVAVLEPGEDVLELHHAGVREHQRRVVARHQRRGRHDPVLRLGEVVEEGGADVVEARHGSGSALGAADDPRACRQVPAVLASRCATVHARREAAGGPPKPWPARHAADMKPPLPP